MRHLLEPLTHIHNGLLGRRDSRLVDDRPHIAAQVSQTAGTLADIAISGLHSGRHRSRLQPNECVRPGFR